ncbi:MAG TPA: hypothetical protein VMV77_03460 [Bacteroidales bacterium]|nr:hypothetical protein [Bacteroidales bacterium]
MKNESKLVCVYEDANYHQKVKRDLEIARVACQRLLNEWLRLDLGKITDMDELQIYPEKCFKRAIDLIPMPESDQKYKVKREAFLATLDLPDPTDLYYLAKETMKVLYCSVPGLFITDGQTVTLDEGIANFYMTMNDIVIPESESVKIALASDLKTWVDLTNSLNIRLNQELFDSSSPVTNKFMMQKFGWEGGDGRGCNATLTLLPEKLRAWLA